MMRQPVARSIPEHKLEDEFEDSGDRVTQTPKLVRHPHRIPGGAGRRAPERSATMEPKDLDWPPRKALNNVVWSPHMAPLLRAAAHAGAEHEPSAASVAGVERCMRRSPPPACAI